MRTRLGNSLHVRDIRTRPATCLATTEPYATMTSENSGNHECMASATTEGSAAVVDAGSIFHFTKQKGPEGKSYLVDPQKRATVVQIHALSQYGPVFGSVL